MSTIELRSSTLDEEISRFRQGGDAPTGEISVKIIETVSDLTASELHRLIDHHHPKTMFSIIRHHGEKVANEAGGRDHTLLERIYNFTHLPKDMILTLCKTDKALIDEAGLELERRRNAAEEASKLKEAESIQKLKETLKDSGFESPSFFSSIGTEVVLVGVKVPGKDALSTWEKLKDLKRVTGYSPIILGSPSTLGELNIDESHYREVKTPETIIQESLKGRQGRELVRSYFDKGSFAELEDEEGANDDSRSVITIDSHIDRSEFRRRTPHKEVLIALIPTTKSYEAPAYLNFGSFNSCPDPEFHVAVLRHFNEQYGAEVVSMNHDTIELKVARQPKSESAARELAKDHFAYCDRCIGETTGSLSTYIQAIQNGEVWQFWWN